MLLSKRNILWYHEFHLHQYKKTYFQYYIIITSTFTKASDRSFRFQPKKHSVQSRRVHSCQMSAFQPAFHCRSSNRHPPFLERGEWEMFHRIDAPGASGPPRLACSLNPSRNLENSCTAWRAFAISSKPSCSSMPPGSCHCAFNWS